MMAAPQYKQGPDAKLKGWHVLLIMLGFFGVMFTVNGIFLYSAITSFPGEDVEKSYLQGLHYNDTLEARREQAELGWTLRAGLVDGPERLLRVEASDAYDAPLSALEISARLRRQATTADDFHLTLQASALRGTYEIALPADLAKGLWDVEIQARSPRGEQVFTATKSIVMP